MAVRVPRPIRPTRAVLQIPPSWRECLSYPHLSPASPFPIRPYDAPSRTARAYNTYQPLTILCLCTQTPSSTIHSRTRILLQLHPLQKCLFVLPLQWILGGSSFAAFVAQSADFFHSKNARAQARHRAKRKAYVENVCHTPPSSHASCRSLIIIPSP